MPDIDLSTLSGAKLRGLLDASRQRGQAAQAYQILQEMSDRRNRARRRAGGHVISMDFRDPADQFDTEPGAGPQASQAWDPARAQGDDAELRLTLDDPPSRARKPSRGRARRDDPPPPPPRRRIPVLGFSMGLALGLVLGVGVGLESRTAAPEPQAAAFPEAPALPSQATTTPPPPDTSPVIAADTAPTPETATNTAASQEQPAATATPADSADIGPMPAAAGPPAANQATPPAQTGSQTAAAPVATPAGPPRSRRVASDPTDVTTQAAAATPPPKACAAAPTAADRTICGDPRLERLQRALRQAYARALSAAPDPGALRQRQLAWRDARSTVTDPDRLARLYQERTRALDGLVDAAR